MVKHPPLWVKFKIMEKLFKTMGQIPNDKLLHFFYGTLIGLPLIYLFDITGLILTIGIAFLKEVIDIFIYLSKDIKPDIYMFLSGCLVDIIYTIMSSILVFILFV